MPAGRDDPLSVAALESYSQFVRKFALIALSLVILAGCGAKLPSDSYTLNPAMVDSATAPAVVAAGEPVVVTMVVYEGALLDGGYSTYQRSGIRVAGPEITITPTVRCQTTGDFPAQVSKRTIRVPIPGLAPGVYQIRVIDKEQTITIPVRVGRG